MLLTQGCAGAETALHTIAGADPCRGAGGLVGPFAKVTPYQQLGSS